MKRLLALFLFALPAYAYATVWQLNAVRPGNPPIIGQFVENNGVIGAWAFTGVPSDCGYFENCRMITQLVDPRHLLFGRDGPSPSTSATLTLFLGVDLGSATSIDLIPGREAQDEFGDRIYSGSIFTEGGYGGSVTSLLTGTITAVPEPSVMAFLLVLLASLQRLYKRRS